jgi:hypothetical protein
MQDVEQGKASEQILLIGTDRKFSASKFLLIGSDLIRKKYDRIGNNVIGSKKTYLIGFIGPADFRADILARMPIPV